jgi:hypothetical protein
MNDLTLNKLKSISWAGKHPFSFNLEVVIGNILTLNLVLGDIYQTDDTTWGSITETSKSDAALYELLSLKASHIFFVVGINITPDEGSTRATQGPVSLFKVARRVNLVNLVALVGVPSTADHGSREGVLIGIDDLPHHGSSWLNRGKITQLWGLDVHVVAYIASNGTGVRWGTRTLAVDALMNGLELVRDTVTYIHVLYHKSVIRFKRRIWLSVLSNIFDTYIGWASISTKDNSSIVFNGHNCGL